MARSKPQSKHSRAARRASSPTDKSLLRDISPSSPSTTTTTTAKPKPTILAPHPSGITKKKLHRKSILSTTARRRRERGHERGAAIGDRTATKVVKSRGRAGLGVARSKGWEEVNAGVEVGGEGRVGGDGGGRKERVRGNVFAGLEVGGDDDDGEERDEQDEGEKEVEWLDEDEGIVAMKDAPTAVGETKQEGATIAEAADASNVPLPQEEEDEVL